MRILFVENRYTTWIFSIVAKELAQSGHEIHWIVQNPIFSPKIGNIHLLPFPKKMRKNMILP